MMVYKKQLQVPTTLEIVQKRVEERKKKITSNLYPPMNHQLQVSNGKEDKSSSSQEEEGKNEESFQENVQENQHLQQWANYFIPPNATLVTKHQNNTQCPSHKEELKKISLKRKPKKAKQDVMEVHGSRIVRATGRKDRHSKVSTATGPKDRRVRLSPNTAIQFYDVQDRLGYDSPSKAIDWLIKEAQTAIDALEKIGSTNRVLNWQTINAENLKCQFALEQSWSADKKTQLEELARHSSKLNATMQYSADQFPEKGYKEQTSKVCQSLNNSQIRNLSLFSSTNDAKIQSFCEFQTYPQGHLHSETKKQPTNDAKIQSFCALQNYPEGHFHVVTQNQSAQLGSFFNFKSSHQNESINFSSDHHQGFLTTKSNLELREDSTFSFSPHNYTSILDQNQLFNYQREPLQSTSNFPQTISYSNIGFANDGLLGTSNAPIIQEEEEHGTLSSTLSAINATTLLHYQD